MLGFFLAPFAILVELNLFNDKFLVLAGPVVNPFAGGTGEFYKSILGHR